MIQGEQRVRHLELNRAADAVAAKLASIEPQVSGRVILLARNSVGWVVASEGVRTAGLGLVPLNFSLTTAEIEYLIEDSGASLVLCDEEHLGVVRSAADEKGVRSITIEKLTSDPSAARDRGPIEVGPSPFILYTSGTSGRPKGAYFNHAPAGPEGEMAARYAEVFDLRSSDVHLVAGPLYHSAPSAFCGITIARGGSAVLMPRFDPTTALRLIEEHSVTTTFMAPILLQRLLDLGRDEMDGFNTSSLRCIITAGAPCPQTVKQKCADAFGEVLYEFYGTTETKAVFVIGPEDQLRKTNSCGREFPGVDVRLLDDKGNQVAEGTVGRIQVRKTPWMFDHYLGDPEKTTEVLRDGWIATDDLASRDAEGFYRICGRVSDMVLSGGVNIYPAEVELALMEHPSVADVAVIGVPDDEWGERLHALVQPLGDRPEPDELMRFLRTKIAGFKVPRSWEFVAKLPRTEDGKLRKSDLSSIHP